MRFRIAAHAALVICGFAFRATAQTIETPVAFDSAQRVMAVTPELAERLSLAPPVWPVAGAYRDARLYRIAPDGGFVLVVSRADGAFERFMLREDQVVALRTAVDAAVAVAGRPVGELAAVPSEPAGNGFARHLTVLSGVVYGPLTASLASDPSGAGALYLLVTGGTFFVSYSAAQSGHITKAQSNLAANLGIATGLAGWGAGYAAVGNSDKGVRALALGSAFAGTIAGASLGRTLTDAEAQGAIAGIEAVAAASWAVSGAAGADRRTTVGVIAASELVGFPLGIAYPRHAAYRVTAGDVNALQTAALVGTLYGAAALGRSGASEREVGIALGSAYVGGALLGDLTIVRPFELTTSEANIGTVGAIAGALMGLAVPVLARSDNNAFVFGAAAAGATLGLAEALAIAKPQRAGSRTASSVGGRRSRLQIRPMMPPLGALLTRRPGAYPIVGVTF